MVMKKMYLVLAALIIGTVSFGQIGFQVIGNASNVSFKSDQIGDAKKSFQAAFGAGIVADLALSKTLSLRPSLNYLQKKNSVQLGAEEDAATLKTSLNFIELPVDLIYT